MIRLPNLRLPKLIVLAASCGWLFSFTYPEQTIAQTVTLYDATQPRSISEQGWPLLASPFLGNTVAETQVVDGTELDTVDPIGDRGGYFSLDPVLQVLRLEAMPEIQSALGTSVRFQLEVQQESHVEGEAGDGNSDGLADRAGFSVIAVNDQRQAIELGFWTDRVWAQDDAREGLSNLFTQSEGIAIDTTVRRDYSLLLTETSYQLFEGAGESILSGTLRDYSPFAGSIDPYETPNFLFFGDNTTRGESRVVLGSILVATHDFNEDGIINSLDIDVWDERRRQTTAIAPEHQHFDLNADGALTDADRDIWLGEIANVPLGDANFDGVFNSTDLIAVFQAGEYEDMFDRNSEWSTGDWNGDQEFDSGDVIVAFQTGSYVSLARTVPEPTGATLSVVSLLVLSCSIRRRSRYR